MQVNNLFCEQAICKALHSEMKFPFDALHPLTNTRFPLSPHHSLTLTVFVCVDESCGRLLFCLQLFFVEAFGGGTVLCTLSWIHVTDT